MPAHGNFSASLHPRPESAVGIRDVDAGVERPHIAVGLALGADDGDVAVKRVRRESFHFDGSGISGAKQRDLGLIDGNIDPGFGTVRHFGKCVSGREVVTQPSSNARRCVLSKRSWARSTSDDQYLACTPWMPAWAPSLDASARFISMVAVWYLACAPARAAR